MKENEKKAFDFASSTTKQLITLSTGLIALTITFSKDIVGGLKDTNSLYLLVWSWAFYIVSVLFGVWTLMALTGSLQPMQNEKSDFDINKKNIRIPAILQILFFLLGLILMMVFGIKVIT